MQVLVTQALKNYTVKALCGHPVDKQFYYTLQNGGLGLLHTGAYFKSCLLNKSQTETSFFKILLHKKLKVSPNGLR